MKRMVVLLVLFAGACLQGFCRHYDYLGLTPASYGDEAVGIGAELGSMAGRFLGSSPFFVQAGVAGRAEWMLESMSGGSARKLRFGAELPLSLGCAVPCWKLKICPQVGIFAAGGVELGRPARSSAPFYGNAGLSSGVDVDWGRYGIGIHYSQSLIPGAGGALSPVRRLSVRWIWLL